MEDSKIFIKLLNSVEGNKYKLIQMIVEKGEMSNRTNPTLFNPFYAGDFIIKVEKHMVKEHEDKDE